MESCEYKKALDYEDRSADGQGPVSAQVQRSPLMTPAFQYKKRLLCEVGKSLLLSTDEDPKKDLLFVFNRVTQMGAVSLVKSRTFDVIVSGISVCELTIKSNSGIVNH